MLLCSPLFARPSPTPGSMPPLGQKRQRSRSVPLPQCGNPVLPAALYPVAGKRIRDSKALGCGIPGFFHWSDRWICSSARRSMTARPIAPACLRRRGAATIASLKPAFPSRLDSLRWSGFHTRVVLALGITWILDGLEVTLAGALSGALKESPMLHFTNFDVGLSNSALSRRRRARRARLRLAHRPHRAQETVLHHACALSHRDRRHRAVLERRELRAVSISHRRRHRRRIHRDQFDDPGTGAGALSRLDRPRHQRQLLDRRGARRDQRHRAARSAPDRSRSRLAAGISHRRLSRPDRVRDADVDSGKSALADDPRPSRTARMRSSTTSNARSSDKCRTRAGMPGRRSNCGCATTRRCARWRRRCSRSIASVRWSGWR